MLSPEGAFTAPGPLHARFRAEERHFRRIGVSFEEVVAGRTAWDSLPPAFVHHCRPLRAVRRAVAQPAAGCDGSAIATAILRGR